MAAKRPHRRPGPIAVFIGFAIAALIAGAAGAETLNVTLGKAKLLRLETAVATVVIGNPDVADVTVESTRLVFVIGQAIGETNLMVLDSGGAEIVNYDVVVVPALDRQVTIHRSTDEMATMSCDPRCEGIENPGDAGGGESEEEGGEGGGSELLEMLAAP
mgnify:CR=1 FL=1